LRQRGGRWLRELAMPEAPSTAAWNLRRALQRDPEGRDERIAHRMLEHIHFERRAAQFRAGPGIEAAGLHGAGDVWMQCSDLLEETGENGRRWRMAERARLHVAHHVTRGDEHRRAGHTLDRRAEAAADHVQARLDAEIRIEQHALEYERFRGCWNGHGFRPLTDVADVEHANQRAGVNMAVPRRSTVRRELEYAMRYRLPAAIEAFDPAGIAPLHGNRAHRAHDVRIDGVEDLDHFVRSAADRGFELHLDDIGRNRMLVGPFAEDAGAIAGEIDATHRQARLRTAEAEVLLEDRGWGNQRGVNEQVVPKAGGCSGLAES